MVKVERKRFLGWLQKGLFISLGILLGIGQVQAVKSAEEMDVTYGPLIFSVSIDSLENYAKTGKIARDLEFFTQSLDRESLTQFRIFLRLRFRLSQLKIYRLTHLDIGEALLKELGKLIKTHPQRNGFYALRAALGKAAANPEGWTIIDVMRQFPTQTIQIDAQDILQLSNEVVTLSNYREAAVQAIKQEAKNEASQETFDISQLPDLRQPGSLEFKKETLKLEHRTIRQTTSGLIGNYSFDVDFYLPQNNSQPAPLVIISHGFGGARENFIYLAKHLASHGLAVAIPEHVGSNLTYRQAAFRGKLNQLFSPIEYLARPREISFLLDELEGLLEREPQWKKRINLEQVGIVGHSLGGTTALSLAGAEINTARLEHECKQEKINLNISFVVQCRATSLPPINYNLRDPRIKAAIASNPFGSNLFGPESLSKIEIPTLMLAGSEDQITPVVQEQIHPFVWLKTSPKYLALLVPGEHFSTIEPSVEKTPFIARVLIGTIGETGKNAEIGRGYLQGLSVAFFEVYLRQRSEYQPYLSASYAQTISQDPLSLSLIQSLTPTELETAYGASPPLPIVPETVIATPTPREETVLTEIQRTGKLEVALRKDAPPFGYLDEEGNWTGYCVDLIDSLANHLAKKLNLRDGIEVIPLPSSLDNRFELVQNDTVHLECGPNTIRSDVEKVTFSEPFFISGTHFLVKSSKAEQIKAGGDLQGIRTGVLRKTTTEQFIQERYPQTQTVYFEGPTGTTEALKALIGGKIDIFANDGILSIGEVVNQNLDVDNYALVPKIPLTCDFYGTILPNDDPQWRDTVNSFLKEQKTQQVWDQWFTELFPYVLLNLDYCLKK
ncbi:MAG: alpha/beta fold hydrolase [Prochloraceae cyanobacterium]